ncbi:uncharacterized protein EV422DRAFT_196979 [Fimicolochytrium jonesii]|uniref:uncharacterized protein n=1 Tax=Fimicolochytrium jonesii TaxID=1396493 RepID=UPI0022FE1676|nr:uncharacterized protein EV422DRAFT_196979 [Fimicolochytrium jonesii]KAI8817902.1 hypothetical protein EV422DRAFT_196979 [Fimicolochytrium jonesii]
MARIKRSPHKRVAALPAAVSAYISTLAEAPEADIPRHVNEVEVWPFPKTDFHHWIPVLNRFDSILETLNDQYDMKHMQSKPFTAEHKILLLAILNFTTSLWKHCTNRSLYNSYEHLSELIYTGDLDVLLATVKLVYRPAQRLGSQRSLRNTLGTAQERINVLAQHWGTKQLGLDLEQLAQDIDIPAECKALNFQFYRTAASTDTTAAADNRLATTLALKPPRTPKPAGEASVEKQTDGLVVINVPDVAGAGKTDRELFMELAEQYRVPEEHKFSLLQKIRLAMAMGDLHSRRKMLTIRILAVAVLVILGSEDTIQSKLFTFEPDLIQRLADMLQKDLGSTSEVQELQAASLYALDSLAHHRARLSEILTAVNASANHGILMFVLRKVITSLDAPVSDYTQEYIDALFGFVAYIASTQSGGNMIITAGILPVLVQLMMNTRQEHIKSVTKCVLLLDSLVFGFSPSFAAFAAANGLENLVQRIQDEIGICISLAPSDPMSIVEDSGAQSAPAGTDLPHERTSLLRALLKFVLHMMQTSGTADRMRNLIETTLPSSLLTIFEQTKLFGASVFGLAVNIMSTFIHNEPTCLSILQEAKLPEALLHAVSKDIPVSAEVISALPNAFGAICLNQAGLDQFNEAKPIEKFLQVFTSEEHLRTLQDNDVPHLVGNSMDELIRHHPSLKEYVLSSIIGMLKRVVEMGEDATPDDQETSTLRTVKMTSNASKTDDNAEDEKKEPRIAQFIHLVARFLEGLFQNVAHCKDFIKMDGVQILLKCYTLPTLPYDFSSSASSYSLSYLFRVLIEVNSQPVVTHMHAEIDQALKDAESFINHEGDEGIIIHYIDIRDDDIDRKEKGQKILRTLIILQGFIRLISDIYCTHILTHSKSVSGLIQTFSGEIGSKLIKAFGALYRTCLWENLLLKEKVPKPWYQSASKKHERSSITRGSMASSLLDVDVLDSVLDANTTGVPASNEEGASAEVSDSKDPRVKNTRYFKHLLSQIPTVLTPLLQGILKLLTARRITESSNRKTSQVVIDGIASLLRDHLMWDRPMRTTSINKYNYLSVVLGFMSVLFVEERTSMALNTNLVVAFHKSGGTKCVLEVFESLWDRATELSGSGQNSLSEDDKAVLARIHGAIEISLSVLQTLANGKLVHESPLTANLSSRERDKASPDYFDPHDYLVDVRTQMAPLVLRVWRSSYLDRAPANIVKGALIIVTHIVKGEGETSTKTDASGSPAFPLLASSIFSRLPQPVAVDEDKVQQLVDMGFPRAAAETALTRCGNHVARAAEYLLTHPSVVAAATYNSARSNANGTGAAGSSETPAAPSSSIAAQTTEACANADHSGADAAATQSEAVPMDTESGAEAEDLDELAAALAMSIEQPVQSISGEAAATEGAGDAIAMEVDPPAEPAVTEDKGKGKAPDINILEAARHDLKEEIPIRCLQLLDNVEDVIFQVKELICLVGAADIPKTIDLLVTDIEKHREAASVAGKSLAVRLRLFALVVSDSTWQKVAIESCPRLLDSLLKMTKSDGTNSPWLPSVLLVLESYISLSDEPKPADAKGKSTAESSAGSPHRPLNAVERMELLTTLVSLMRLENVDKEMLHAVLRLTVRLTRFHGLAVEFARLEGIPLLFEQSRIGLFQAQPAMTVMILRHVIEDFNVLKSTMEREIANWFNFPRQRMMDISSFVKNNSHLVSRDLQAFISAVADTCFLPRFDPASKTSVITLKPKEEEKTDVSPPEEITLEGVEKPSEPQPMDIEGPAAVDPNASMTSAPTIEQLKSLYLSDVSETVVQYLVNEVLALKHTSAGSPTLQTLPSGSGSDAKHAEDKTASSSTDGSISPESVHLKRCFLLQCLSELVVSYPTCKIDVINATQKRLKGTPHKGSSGRNPFLNHLLHDLLPHSIKAQTESPLDLAILTPELQKDFMESQWTISVISGLCLGVTADLAEERKLYPDLAHVRRCVLDVIARFLKDAVNHADVPTQVRYSRFFAASDLCFKLLTARGPARSTTSPAAATPEMDDIPTHLARAMMEKGFVTLLTQVLAEIDLHHPESKRLVSAVLKPLELLTKLAIKLGKTVEARSTVKADAGGASAGGVVPMEETNTELSDMIRNSALGMYNAPTSDDEMDEGSTGDSEDEDGYDDFSEDDLTGDEDLDDEEGSDVDDDMEIVMPQPYQGNPDPSTEDDEDEDDDDDMDDDMDDDLGDEEFDDDNEDDIVEEGDEPDESDAEMSWDDGHVEYHDLTPDRRVSEAHSDAHQHDHLMDALAPERARLGHDEAHEEADQMDSDGDAPEVIDDEDEDSEEEDEDMVDDMYDDDRFVDGEEEETAFFPVGGGPGLAHRGFGLLQHSRGSRPRRIARRQVMEVDMTPGGGVDIHWVPEDGNIQYVDGGDFQVLGRPLGMRQTGNEDIMTHPLLVNQAPAPTAEARYGITDRARGPASIRAGDVLDWQAFDNMIGGNALQILEQLFARTGAASQYRVEVPGLPDMTGSIAAGGLVAGLPLPGRAATLPVSTPVAEGSNSQEQSVQRTAFEERIAVIHGFAPLGTSERWWQEARLMYGTSVNDKGIRAVDAVVEALKPAAMEAAQKRKEKEEIEKKRREEEAAKRKEEEERKRKEEEEQERLKKEELERQKRAEEEATAASRVQDEAHPSAAPDIPAEPEVQEASASQELRIDTNAAPPERVIVTVHGNPVDITGSGIDVTFLEALPDDLRQEVINQHLGEQQRSQRATTVPPTISSEFLDALPADIRDEVLAQERRERERRERASQPAAATTSAGPMEIDPASFLATLDPLLRQSVLQESDDGFLATLPPGLVAEANAFRGHRARSRFAASQQARSLAAGLSATGQPSALPGKRPGHREAVHLLDKAALTTLIRMLFLPENVGKQLIHKTLVNLCENSKTRLDLISLFLSILVEGSTDLASVDRSFAQMSIRGKGKFALTPKKGPATPTPPTTAGTQGENGPNIVAQRCLEALTQMVTYNEGVARLLLVENEMLANNPFKTPKKGKGKEKVTDNRYPVVVLLSLLQRPTFLNSAELIEQLMHIISIILRLSTIMTQKAKEARAEQKATDSTSPTVLQDVSSVPASSSTAPPPEEPIVRVEAQRPTQTPKKPTNSSVTEFKPPSIPEQYVSAVVKVLTTAVCSGKTFQYTLSVVQHLCSLANNREIITRELTSVAQGLGDAMIPDVDELIVVLQSASTAVEVQSATLGKFSHAGALQAKLLRVLKTMDFIHTKHGRHQEKQATNAPRPAPSAADATPGTGEASAVQSDQQESPVASEKDKEIDLETKLTTMYDSLQLPKLWQRLGACLSIINEKDALIHVATVLLPAIESFMVVSKPYVMRKKPVVAATTVQTPALSRVPTHQSADLAKNNEELFVSFTEEHRKILNTMVRNSPSLMSGSFCLLVQNPKVLEFDNKRTYFNQQLHKRTSRDHYGSLQINVRRQYVFEDSYHQLQGRSGDEIKFSKLNVRFYEEEGVDAGGVTREWFSVLARQMFNPDYALFRPSAVDKVTYQPNRLSGINPDHLLYFKFVGRVIGKAIYDGRLLDAYFTRSFYKSMIGAQVDYKDMEAVDPEFHKSLEWILQNDITDVLDLTFSTEIDEFGKKQTIDLKPDGRNIPVTEQNKHEYVKLVVNQRLVTAIHSQIEAFLGGFHDVIPKDLVKIFNEQELELLISGMPDIDIDDWKNNTEYRNYTASSPQVQWFWRAVRSFSQEERAKLVQFATGTSKVPLEGFAEIQGSSGTQKFQIHKDFASSDRLPSAHTCFNQLDLPAYETYDQLRASLLLAISEGGTGFGFA